MQLFTPDNVEDFVRITGDNNPLHYKPGSDRSLPGTRQLVSGLHQLTEMVKAYGWSPGKKIDLELRRMIWLPTDASVQIEDDSIWIKNSATVFSIGMVSGSLEESALSEFYDFQVGNEREGLDVQAYLVGKSAGVLLQLVAQREDYMQDVLIPGVRDGSRAGFISGLSLRMFDKPLEQDSYEFRVARQSEHARGAVFIAEAYTSVFAHYSLEMRLSFLKASRWKD